MRKTILTLLLVAISFSGCQRVSQSQSVAENSGQSSTDVVVENKTLDLTETSTTIASPDPKPAANTAVEEWGTITGRIVVDGAVPEPKKLEATKDADFCGAEEEMKSRQLIVAKDGGLKNAFLFLYLARRKPQKPDVHPSYEKSATDKHVIDNVNCLFTPHAVGMRTTQILTAKNSDPKGHNVQITSRVNGQNPNLPAKSEIDLKMKGPERLPVKVQCAIHPWMVGYLLVRDDPYFAITDDKGNFEIKNMPEGEWKFQFWHERCGYMSDLVDKDGKKVMSGRPVTMTIKVENGKTVDLGTMKIAADSLKGE